MTSKTLTIATRGSRLALWQAEHVKSLLQAKASEQNDVLAVELLIIKTKGDKILDVPLAKVGGKGLFVKEIEQALLDRRADLAVHSMKDVPAELAEGLSMAAISERVDASDALVSTRWDGLESLPPGAVIGTSSLRRASQLLAIRPDLLIAPLRGNVPTRIGKLDAGEYDGVILASAGLIRLGFADRIRERLAFSVCLPAAGQGALGMEIRTADRELAEFVASACGHPIDGRRVVAERAFLGRLGGGCQVPLAAYATYADGQISLDGLVASLDGKTILRATHQGAEADAEDIGRLLAEKLIGQGADKILASI